MKKRFLKKKLLGIPIVALIILLAGGAVMAALYFSTIQTITQTITEPPPPPDYGTITAPDIDLQDLTAGGQSFGGVWPLHVEVELGPDGVGKHLWLELDESTLYAEYEVKLVCKASADEGIVPIGTTVIVDEVNWRTSIPLGNAGTYRFDEYIHLKTGSVAGEASTDFKIAISSVAAP
ncbi:hypothetical protein ES703_114621 [subsurface metagenome]